MKCCNSILISADYRWKLQPICCVYLIYLFMFPNSLKYSSLWWAKVPGVMCCQILRGSTFGSSCRSFLTTIFPSRTAPSVICSTTVTLTLEIPCILHKNFSEVLPSCLIVYLPAHAETLVVMPVTVSPSDGYFNPEVVKYRQLCAKSQRKRQLYSLQQYYHRLLKQILVSRKVICLKACKTLILYRLFLHLVPSLL